MHSRPNPAIFQQTVQPYNLPQLSQPTAPPSQAFPPRNLIPNRSQPPILPPPRGSEIICYGCGEKGHGLSSCVKIHDLLTKGLLAKDFAGRIVNKDGSPVRRMMGETFVQAMEHEQRPQSHYITFQEKDDSERSESEGEDNDVVLAISGTDFNVFKVERPAKQIATKRKMVMEGVYPPRLKDLKDKENHGPPKNPDTGRKIRATKGQPSAVGVPREIRKKEKQGEPIPVDTDKPRYDGNDDDQIMEDAVQPGQKAISKRKDQPNRVSEVRTIEKWPPCKSAVSAHVNDAELPSLFTAPPSVHTEGEHLLMGHGDLTHFSNNQHIRHIIASSPRGIIVGHLPDQHGNQRTDMMLFNMGLISAVSPNAPNSSNPIDSLAGTDVQRGMGILHFYPNLGTNAPGDWEIPYFRPPNPVAVSGLIRTIGLIMIHSRSLQTRQSTHHCQTFHLSIHLLVPTVAHSVLWLIVTPTLTLILTHLPATSILSAMKPLSFVRIVSLLTLISAPALIMIPSFSITSP